MTFLQRALAIWAKLELVVSGLISIGIFVLVAYSGYTMIGSVSVTRMTQSDWTSGMALLLIWWLSSIQFGSLLASRKEQQQ